MTHFSASASAALPLLDLRRLGQGAGERVAFLAELRERARDFGFFYVTGHGIAPAVMTEVLGWSRRFFALPDDEKNAIAMVNSPHFRGYTRVGLEHTRGRPDWREQIDIGAERPALPEDPAAPWKRLQGPNQWPRRLPGCGRRCCAGRPRRRRLPSAWCAAFAAALGQDEEVFAPIYRDRPTQLLKIIRYPGRESGQDEQGVGPHKDGGFVTVLLQDTQAGLQVETEPGLDRCAAGARNVHHQRGRSAGSRLQRVPARQRAPRALPASPARTGCRSLSSWEPTSTRRCRC